MLAVLGERCRADDLYLAAREGGLQYVRCVHAALGVARADDIVYLVNDENDVALLAYLLDEPLHAALELSAELRPRDKRRQVEQKYLLILKLIRHIAHRDALRQPLGDRRLADARLTDETGVILLAAVEDLDNALKLLLAPDHRVELPVAGALGQVDAVIVEELPLALGGRGVGRVLPRLILRRGGIAVLRAVLPAGTAEQTAEEREGGGLAVVVLAVLVLPVHRHQILHAVHGVEHVAGDVVEIVVGNAHLVYHVVHGLYVQLARALEAEPFILGLPVFYLCDKYDRHVFSAAGTQCRLHIVNTPFCRSRH